MKGIVLAGGAGTRLTPLTQVVCKQLLPVYNKPMVYYPLSILMLAGIREILIISTSYDIPMFERLLGDGSQWGVKFKYAVQEKPRGIAEALLIAEDFLAGQPCALVLGDNILYKDGLQDMLKDATARVTKEDGAVIFAYHIADPERYGVVELDEKSAKDPLPVLSIEEKPIKPKSHYAAIGLYFYDKNASKMARTLKPSARGELEITDLNRVYLQNGNLSCIKLGRGAAWLDAGTHDSLLESSQFVATLEKRQGLKIADLEEIGKNVQFL
jgi:glucose-1-phosphate thymidylyltransferase